jgi:cytohesin
MVLVIFAKSFHSVLEFLIQKGANVTEKTIDGLNALHLAIRSGSDNDQLVKLLIDVGTPISGKTNSGDTPLHYSAYMGYLKSASLLISRGASLEEKGQNDSTPLHFAAREGQIELVKLLISKGARIDSQDKDGKSKEQSMHC